MAQPFPYTHYACPCSETANSAAASNRNSQIEPQEQRTFDPHDPRAAYALNTLDRLLFCDECTQIRCQRCTSDEIINWFCPSCLFDVPSSVVRGDGNRCSRNCYNCPICTAPVVVTAVEQRSDGLLRPDENTPERSFILVCHYCNWTTLDIGITFNRETKITEQLNKLRKARVKTSKEKQPLAQDDTPSNKPLGHEETFEKLTAFYKEQLAESGDLNAANSNYSSPANLQRIMSLYGGLSYNALKKSKEKPQPMREAAAKSEGFSTYTSQGDEDEDEEIIANMANLGWDKTVSGSQRLSGPVNYDTRFTDELWPTATALRTKRGRRCRTCRQFIARPEHKVLSTRYKIRILASNNIPRLSLRPLQPSGPTIHSSFVLRSDQVYQEPKLQPHVPQQYVLTMRNPIFETVKITLATPAVTPGRVASRVTILCPSFTIGAAGDVWDDALSSSTSTPHHKDGGRQAAMASLTGRTDVDRQPEAGKIWEQTRNSTSVILEIVPGALKPPPSIIAKNEETKRDEQLQEDDDVLEIPIYVRAEWTVETAGEGIEKGKGEKEPRELGYWAVLGVGRIVA